jgi:DNA anti-recombination protein RmuC
MQRATWTDERLDDLAQSIDRRFDQVDLRFQQVDQRFEQIDRRFEQVDRRFDRVDDSIRHLTTMLMWTAGGIIASLIGVLGAIAINGGA